jgi:hypothetical protein
MVHWYKRIPSGAGRIRLYALIREPPEVFLERRIRELPGNFFYPGRTGRSAPGIMSPLKTEI